MLSIDYSCELASQAQFEQFHQLFVQIRRLYFNHEPDDGELHQLVVAFINSPPFVPMAAAAMRNKNVIVTGLGAGIVGYAVGNHLGVLMAQLLALIL